VKVGNQNGIVIVGYPNPGSYPINITYPDVSVPQIQKLTDVSGFCSQA